MQEEILSTIARIIQTDETISAEEEAAILSVCRRPPRCRKLLTAKEVMKILEISRPTLRAYAKSKKLEQINISTRKVRFDEASVLRLANMGGAQ